MTPLDASFRGRSQSLVHATECHAKSLHNSHTERHLHPVIRPSAAATAQGRCHGHNPKHMWHILRLQAHSLAR